MITKSQCYPLPGHLVKLHFPGSLAGAAMWQGSSRQNMSRNGLSHSQTGPQEQSHDSLAFVPPLGGTHAQREGGATR